MENRDYASIFLQVAKLLELEDKVSPFEIIAYRKVARALDKLDKSVENIYFREGETGLLKIKGIGKGIAGSIIQIATTGKLKKLDLLRKKLPTPLLDFADIPGVGAKNARKLFLLTRSKTIKQLKQKLKFALANPNSKLAKRLEKNSILEKSLTKILNAISSLENRSGRMLLSDALPIACKMRDKLKKIAGVQRADFAGSLRRMKETVGDIDIVASVKKTKGKTYSQTVQMVINAFCRLPEVAKVVNKGQTKARLIHERGAQVDLEVLPSNQYGSLLQHLTGSKEHNVALRRFALKQNKSLSEHGIKPKESTKTTILKYPTEKGFYRALGLDFIPPELRENLGEIESASTHNLPQLIRLEDIRGDLQMHTTLSDGKASLELMRAGARQLSYEYILITDHSDGLGITGGHNATTLARARQKIDKLNREKGNSPFLLLGIEVNIKSDGSLDIDDAGLAHCDLVVASIHSSFNQTESAQTARLLKAINHPRVNIIAHPSGRLIERRDPIKLRWQTIFDACKKSQVALEINASPARLDLNDNLARLANKAGVKLVISTDAHSVKQLDNMIFGVTQARRAWLTKDDVLNTMSLSQLLKWFQKKEDFGATGTQG